MAWENYYLYHLTSSADHTKFHETLVFKILNNFAKLLLLIIIELLLGHLDGDFGVNFCTGVTFVGFGFINFANHSHVDVAVHDFVVAIDDESLQACQEVC